jgi:hypothetical protein
MFKRPITIHSGGVWREVFAEVFLIGVSLTYRRTGTFMNNDALVHPFSSSTSILYNKITCTK